MLGLCSVTETQRADTNNDLMWVIVLVEVDAVFEITFNRNGVHFPIGSLLLMSSTGKHHRFWPIPHHDAVQRFLDRLRRRNIFDRAFRTAEAIIGIWSLVVVRRRQTPVR
ncbi:hypothetical protein D3C87_1507500 [compost metagenome]